MLEMFELALRMMEETGDEASLHAMKDRFLGHDVHHSLTAPSMIQFDHLPAYLDTLRGWLERCYTSKDISRQRAVVQAKIHALKQDDLDTLVRIDQYDRQDYWKEPVTLEHGQLIRHLDEELLGADHEPAIGLPQGPLPGVYADRYDKQPGLLRLGVRLTIPGLPSDMDIGGTITASLVGAVKGNACPLDVEPEEGLNFVIALPEDTLWHATRDGEEQLLRVEVNGSFGAFAAYVTCPTDERLFRDDAQALWLRRLQNGRVCFAISPIEPGPLVSVILPVHNARETLPRAVRSLFAQTHENLEIMLIDDGSDDGSAELCDAYAAEDARVKAFHLDHGGVARARNFALERYTGDHLMFVDADDLVSPDIVARLLEVLRQSGQQIASCIAKDTDDQHVEKITCAQRFGVNIWRWGRINYHSGLSRRVIWGSLYRQTAVEGLRFDERYVASTDTLFFAEAARRVRQYAQVNEQHYCYVYYPNSVCHRNSDQRKLDDILIWERILKMNPAGSTGYRSAWRELYLKLRRLMNECALRRGHDLSVCLEARRIARRHRRDMPRGKNRKQWIARRLFMTAPVAYMLVSKGKRAFQRLRGKGK